MKTHIESNRKIRSLARDFAALAKKHSLVDPRLILADDTHLIVPGDGNTLVYRQTEQWTKLKD